jgi:hypothetical protein
MKITKEMVDAMGGFNSVHYQSFKSYCVTAYNILRKSANLILNLFGLMVDANIPDIKAEPDKAVWKVKNRGREIFLFVVREVKKNTEHDTLFGVTSSHPQTSNCPLCPTFPYLFSFVPSLFSFFQVFDFTNACTQ